MSYEDLLAWNKEGNFTIPSFLLTHYSKMGLNEKEMLLLLHLQFFHDQGNDFPTPDEIAERMSVSPFDCLNILRRLVQQGFVEILEEMSDTSILGEKYSLMPLQEKMMQFFLLERNKLKNVTRLQSEESLYTIFEKEFGRALSPFECESLSMWMDEHENHSVIKAALREAVISGKLNFRYIDRILFEWKRNGIKTEEQAVEYSQKFRTYQKREKKEEQIQHVPFYNWLEK
ncbi:DnaD domain-containing protein [Peribacillus acanthi]|uniref:DnaD domain-containing protein n=1 Tax=Peribacillus acanthi TaxID=2171554 RepID=UPI000D3E9A4A|nr:DnaD domain-containing protein [Peribacillus acanthi]